MKIETQIMEMFYIVAGILQDDGIPVRWHQITNLSWGDNGIFIVADLVLDSDQLDEFEAKLFEQHKWKWLTRSHRDDNAEFFNVTLELRPRHDEKPV